MDLVLRDLSLFEMILKYRSLKGKSLEYLQSITSRAQGWGQKLKAGWRGNLRKRDSGRMWIQLIW